MGDFSNALSNAEIERLALLSEEAGELVQVIGKILRHGYESYNPYQSELGSNREQLEAEIGDLLYSIELMHRNNDIDKWSVEAGCDAAIEKKPKYLHHQTELPRKITVEKGLNPDE